MSDSADKLSSKQHKAIAVLMASTTIATAAKAAGVEDRTIYRWLDEPAFDAAYRAARREAVKIATARLQQVGGAAVVVLCQLMANGTQAIKLSAAKTVLDLAIKAIELEDIAARLAALERAHEQKL
jgi:hypothetical protein